MRRAERLAWVWKVQECAARIDKIDTRQIILERNLLCAQMFLYAGGVVSAAFHRRIVGDDHAFDPLDPANAGNHPGTRNIGFIHPPGSELTDLEKRRTDIQELAHAIARQQLAAGKVFLARPLVATELYYCRALAQAADKRRHRSGILGKLCRARIHIAGQYRHHITLVRIAERRQAVSANNSRPISMRRISLVPAPISYSFASRRKRPVGYSLM